MPVRLHPRFPPLLALLFTLLLGACGGGGPALSPLPPDASILAFGDSLTYGTGAPTSQSYPAVLEALSGRQVVREGVPGEQTPAGLERLPGVLDRVQPRLLILCHGGNDMLRKRDPAETVANLRRMVQIARERGIEVVLVGVPAPGIFLGTAELYRRLAEELALPFEGKALADILADRDLKSDTIHPNAAGYRRLAEAIDHLLREHGALPER